MPVRPARDDFGGGAGRARQFFSITVPQIRATIIFIVITSTIGGLQIFDEVRMYDAYGLGGPDKDWMTTVVYLYDVAWGTQKNFGRAAAIAWLLFLLIVVIGMVNFLATRRIATSGPRAPKVSRRHTQALLAQARAAAASSWSSQTSSATSTGTGRCGRCGSATTCWRSRSSTRATRSCPTSASSCCPTPRPGAAAR